MKTQKTPHYVKARHLRRMQNELPYIVKRIELSQSKFSWPSAGMVIRTAFTTSKRYSVGKPTLVCALANFSADFGIICSSLVRRRAFKGLPCTIDPAQRVKIWDTLASCCNGPIITNSVLSSFSFNLSFSIQLRTWSIHLFIPQRKAIRPTQKCSWALRDGIST